MKKLFITLITCIVIVCGFMFVTRSNFLYNKLEEIFESDEAQIDEIKNKYSAYWYNTLSDREQEIYRKIVKGIDDMDKKITIDIVKQESVEFLKKEIDNAINAYFADFPEVFYVKGTYEISSIDMLVAKKVDLKLQYITDDKNEINVMKEKLNNEIEKINSKLLNAKSDYEKELLLHDILAKEIVYFEHTDYNEIPQEKHNVYSALVEKSAVCDGITKAFQLILMQNGIESIFVTGVTENVPHAWCKVKLDNEYYNVDLTSDKVLNKENSELIVHSYFNITDKEIMNTHQVDNYEKLPKSNENKYNYYTYNNYEISYIDDFEYKLSSIVKSQSNNKLLEFKVSSVTDAPAKIVNALYSMNFNGYKTNNITKVEYNKINDNYIIVK